jgi:hypothetical protein
MAIDGLSFSSKGVWCCSMMQSVGVEECAGGNAAGSTSTLVQVSLVSWVSGFAGHACSRKQNHC